MARRTRSEDDAESEGQVDELEAAEAAIDKRRKPTAGGKKDKGKGRRSRGYEEDDDMQVDDEDGPGAKKSGGKTKLSTSEIEDKARELVRYAICNEVTRKPLRRDDINKKVLAGATRSFQHVHERANVLLGKTFGMELVEVYPRAIPVFEKRSKTGKNPQTRKPSRDADASTDASASENEGRKKGTKQVGEAKQGPAKMFALRTLLSDTIIRKALEPIESKGNEDVSRLNSDVIGAIGTAAPEEVKDWKRGNDAVIDWQTSPDQRALLGVLYVVLALILVNERVLTDEQLVSHLKRLDLRPDSQLPLNVSALKPEKQNVNGFLGTLIKQGYLEKSKLAATVTKQGTQAAGTQRIRATQITQKAQRGELEDGTTPNNGSADEEWRWGPRADVEIGEAAVAEFINAFFETYPGTNQRNTDDIIKEVSRGANAGKDGKLECARTTKPTD